jgi:hypothetical protein
MKNKLREDIKKLGATLSTTEGNFNTLEVKTTVAKLQEQLAVLAYLESQIEVSETSALDSKSYREDNWFKEPVPVPQPEHKDELVEPATEKIKDIVAQMPPESQKIDELLEEILPRQKTVKNDLEDFAESYQKMPTFTRKDEKSIPATSSLISKEASKGTDAPKKVHKLNEDPAQPKSLNDSIGNALSIGLNDRLAFVKHLFESRTDDYQRVLSQINTMENFNAAASFIKNNVKPDYNDWSGKEVYEERFMAIVEKNFN